MAVYAFCSECQCRRDVCKLSTAHQRHLTWIADWQPGRGEPRMTKRFGPDLTNPKQLAESQLAAWKTDRARGQLGIQKKVAVTFADLADKYWSEHAAVEGHHPERTTFYTVQQAKEWIGPTRKVGPLSEDELKELQNDLRGLQRKLRTEGLKGATVNRYFNILRSIFERGREWGLIQVNPLEFVNRVQEETPMPRFIEAGEVDALFRTAESLVTEHGTPFSSEQKKRLTQYMTMLYHTGARPSSIEECSWDNGDVDLQNRVIRFTTYKGGRHEKKHSYWVPMDDTVLKLVVERGEETGRKGLVFDCRYMNKLTRLVVEQSGVNKDKPENMRFSIYGLKHCYASNLLMNGRSTYEVGKLLGHTDGRMVEKHYGHLTLSHLRNVQNLPRRELKVI